MTAVGAGTSVPVLTSPALPVTERSMDYTCWGISELVHELQVRDGTIREWETTLLNALRERDWDRVKNVRDELFEKMQESNFSWE